MRYIWQMVHWPRFHWDMSQLMPLLTQTRREQGFLLGELGALGVAHSQESRALLMSAEAIQNTAIEGVTLNPQSVRSSIAHHLGLPGAGPIVDRNAEGLVNTMFDALNNHHLPLTIARLFLWHRELFPTGQSGLKKIGVGKWRGGEPMRVVSGPIGREKIHFEAPPVVSLPREMKLFLRWFNSESRSMDGLVRAGLAHLYFVTLHPFEDGNGRLARVLTDVALAQDENSAPRFYSLSTQIMRDRDTYYDQLERAQKGDLDVTPWLSWFMVCCQKAMIGTRDIVGDVLWRARFWVLHQGLVLNQRQKKVIDRILESGRRGFEGGLTTRKYVGMTKTSRATAFREISDLVEKGVLARAPGAGRNARYSLRTVGDVVN